MPLPTVRAALEGRVQGVVVQARKYTFSSPAVSKRNCDRSFFTTLNWAVSEVSFTSLYVPGWFSSCELRPVPAAGE
ncbi:hypothetical protein D9M69_724300 [compost metagenome]